MRILTSWLKEFVAFKVPVKALAEDLTMLGLEVEEIESVHKGLDSVIIGHVEETIPHPRASHLKICRVSLGREEVQVVCGAPNVKEGQLVALARPGTVLPGDKVIRPTKIYGVRSEGMLCSGEELGIGHDSTGILVLEPGPGINVGRPLIEAMGIDDWVLDIGVTANRPDCLSVLGVAREVSAMYDIPLYRGQGSEVRTQGSEIPISIENPELCRRYAAAVMEGVKVGPSPDWLITRLEASGIRSINNVVDATNYVLMEYGQPLHAFDLDRLIGPEVMVRTARSGETITTLDGRERELQSDMLVIADRERPIAIAGVMGGSETEVDVDTGQILLESAWFTPVQIRRTSRALKLSTEASYRFERGIDPNGVMRALYRVIGLIAQIAGGHLVGTTDIYPRPYRDREVSLRPQRANRLIGIDIGSEKMADLLKRIGIKVLYAGDKEIRAIVPSYRPDLKEEVDLIEEIARLYGFSNIPTLAPRARIVTQAPDLSQGLIKKIKNVLMAHGMTEVISYSFVSPRDIDSLGFSRDDPRMQIVKIQNPLSDDQSVMRTNLISSLMGAVARNQAHRNQDLALFELGAVFYNSTSGELPKEEQRLALLYTGSRHSDLWSGPKGQIDIFDLKGVLEGLFQAIRVSEWKVVSNTPHDPFYLPGSSARIVWRDGSVLGTFGEVAQDVLDAWDINGPIFVSDLSMDSIERASCRQITFCPLPRYPAVERDTAIVVSDQVSVQDLMDYISTKAPEVLEGVKVFDVYRGRPVPEGSKSIGLRFRYRAPDRTLSDQAVSKAHRRLIRSVLQYYKAELRE